MKNKPINTGRTLLYVSVLLFASPFFSNVLTPKKWLLPDTTEIMSMKQFEVHGTVTDTNGMPLAGVTIRVQGTQRGTSTDFNGAFTIKAKINEVLVFSFIGYKTQKVPIDGATKVNVVMETDVTALNAVEINAGYYTVRDKERTGNISKITAKDIEKQPVNNPLGAMQGYMPGVNIVQKTGVPGGGYDIAIRGKNFINGSTEPLYIVDGVPYGSQSLEDPYISVAINAGDVSPLNTMDPSNIESIEVLKDADATAIYGSRGANGVVLISTKKGKSGKIHNTISASSSLGHVTHFLELMNTPQYLEVRKEALINSGWDYFNPISIYSWPDLSCWSQTRYTDWQKELIGGTAHRDNAKITFSGGGDRTQFLISGSYLKETTVFPGNSSYKKTSVFNKLNHHSRDNRFQINMSMSLTHDNNNLPRWDITNEAYSLPPNAPELYDEQGKLNWEGGTFDNPLAYLEEKYRVKTSNLMINANFSYELLPNLHFKTNAGYSKYQLDSDRILPNTSRNPIKFFFFTPQNYSNITINNSNRDSWIIEPQITWRHNFGKTNIHFLVGTTFQSQTSNQMTINGKGFPNNGLIYNIAAANTVKILNNSNSKYNYQAVFGRINLNYDKKYIVNLTGRRDGSSRFGPGKRYGNFGAVGLAWLFSNEKLFKDHNILSYGKLRGSYGITGSDNIGDYKYLSTYEVTGNNYNGTTIIEPTGIFNPEFGWETNKKLETGIELGFFENHVKLNTSWYKNKSSNQLVGIPLAATTGFSILTANFDATVENTGWEFDINTINVNTNGFKWTSYFNLTIPKNKLVSFPGLESSTFANQYVIGRPLTMIRLYHSLGVDPETGIYQFEDYNKDGEIKSVDDKQWIVDFAPKFYGGMGNTLSYHGLTLKFLFQFKKQISFNYKRSMANPGAMSNGPVDLLQRWQVPGDRTDIMRASYSESGVRLALENQMESSGAISDASFIRLRNIDLSFKLPPNTLGNNLDISIYLQGQNLWTITGFDGPDPEQPNYNILPPIRMVSLGVELDF
ncbi:SusC/RagA family TonB-linked outer membrane protein [Yeosuana marina]|uniref:SusC/RagA family TonB-linked outer membrane protein n=1 Tax=Yeosuana marina TaxID=1565536 RepID=UPI0030C83124